MDTVDRATRSRIMSSIKSKWTAPERRVYEGLLSMGLEPSVHEDDLPGKPDFVFLKERIAVFVEGCFWHGCPKHYKPPKSNKQFWLPKIEANMRRDRRNRRKLRIQGIGVVRVWECATRGRRLENALGKIAGMVAAA